MLGLDFVLERSREKGFKKNVAAASGAPTSVWQLYLHEGGKLAIVVDFD